MSRPGQRHKGVRRINLRQARRRSRSAEERRTKSARSKAKRLLASILKLGRLVFFLIGFVLGVAADALNFPKYVLDFKNTVGEAKQYVNSLIYRHSHWTGIVDTFPEGIVDWQELEITSPVEAALDIAVVDGNLLDGTIWWLGSCNLGLPYQGLLVEGRIHLGGNSADVQVFDFVGGRRINFFAGVLTGNGEVVEFSSFPENLGLNGSRIALNPHPAQIEHWTELYCEEFLGANSDARGESEGSN